MNLETFTQMLDRFQNNLEELYTSERANLSPQLMLGAAYKELGIASEELQVALEELMVQTEELMATQTQLEEERQHYRNLFDFLPDAYLVTNAQRTILQANQASATLFNIEPQFLLGKPLDIFFAQHERQRLLTKLERLRGSTEVQKWIVSIQPRQKESVEVVVSVAPICDREGKVINFGWSMYQSAQVPHIQPNLQPQPNKDLLDRQHSKQIYHQGEIIPLKSDLLWIVTQGWVKLNTLNSVGEQVLVGLVGKNMPFGSSLTCLPTYQATVLSQKVQLVSIPLTEFDESHNLREILLPKIIERLGQTESLMSISGVRQIPVRIHQLLLWLQEHFGQPSPQGIRLKVRLTHQELASTCGTTRVTITRELSKLKKQGAISYDDKHHLIFISQDADESALI